VEADSPRRAALRDAVSLFGAVDGEGEGGIGSGCDILARDGDTGTWGEEVRRNSKIRGPGESGSLTKPPPVSTLVLNHNGKLVSDETESTSSFCHLNSPPTLDADIQPGLIKA
jgi:hypothetical protein